MSVPAVTRSIVWAKNDGLCWYCGDCIADGWFHVDHKVPRCKGGGDDIDNLLPSCPTCNMEKGAKDYEEYRELLRVDMFPVHDYYRMCGDDIEMPHYPFDGEMSK